MKKIFCFAVLLACFMGVSQAQVTVAPITNPRVQFFNNSVPCAGCLLDTFAAGTTTPLATYSESTGTTPNANPVVLGSDGSAVVYLTSASYKFRLRSALGVTLWTQDVISWNTPLSTFAGLSDAGNFTQTQPTAATNVANQSSFSDCMNGTYWTGAVSATDSWCLQDVLGTGISPTSAFNLTHSGSSGATSFNIATLLNTCAENNIYIAGSSCYPTIASAITAAAAANGSIRIPANYAGTEAYTTPSLNVDDRRSTNGLFEFRNSSFLAASRPITLFPLGNDVGIRTMGPADSYIENVKASTSTTTSLIIGVNTNVLVGAVIVSNLTRGTMQTGDTSLLGSSHANGIRLGRETPNEEIISPANFTVVDATHVNITCALAHTIGNANNGGFATIVIEELGEMFISFADLIINSHALDPSNLTGRWSPMRIKDSQGNVAVYVPANINDPAPYKGFQWQAKHYGFFGGNKDLRFGNSLTTSSVLFQNNAENNIVQIFESSGGAIVDIGNPTTFPMFRINTGQTDLTRLIFNGSSAGAIFFGSGGGTGTSGVFHLRNNQTDQTEKITLDTSQGNVTSVGSFISSVATGTAPLTITSTTAVANLTVQTCSTCTVKESTLLISTTAPTIAAGGCGGAAASIATNNGPASFTVNVGTTPTAAGCVIGLPTATNGWNCSATDITTNSTSVFLLKQTAAGSSTTQATIVNFSDVAVAAAPTASDIWQVSCFAR